MPYGKQILANNSLDNGLLPDGIKPLPEPTVQFERTKNWLSQFLVLQDWDCSPVLSMQFRWFIKFFFLLFFQVLAKVSGLLCLLSIYIQQYRFLSMCVVICLEAGAYFAVLNR